MKAQVSVFSLLILCGLGFGLSAEEDAPGQDNPQPESQVISTEPDYEKTLAWLQSLNKGDNYFKRWTVEKLATRIKSLDVSRHLVTDKDVKTYIAPLKGLTQIKLDATMISNQSIQLLKNMTELNFLSLQNTNLNDQAFSSNPFPKISFLRLGKTKITGEQWDPLQFPELKTLSFLRSRHISDTGLQNIAGTRSLKSLDLSYTKISDEGIAHLVALPELKYLLLNGSLVSDKALWHVRSMPSLKQLSLIEARGVSVEGVEKLRIDMPGLDVRTKSNRELMAERGGGIGGGQSKGQQKSLEDVLDKRKQAQAEALEEAAAEAESDQGKEGS